MSPFLLYQMSLEQYDNTLVWH